MTALDLFALVILIMSQPPKIVPSFGSQLGRLAWLGSGIQTKTS